MESFIVLVIFIGAIVFVPRYFTFRGSNYKTASGNSFLKTLFDRGNYGEYLTFLYLEKIEGNKRLLTNLYIPRKDGTTTEIDLIMISEKGIYVFESKNYSGWIFGDEKNRNWTQTLNNRRKNYFFNPIWQNKAHINALKSVVGIDDARLYKSYIIFSERCTLKKVHVTSPEVKVLKRNDLIKAIKKDFIFSEKVLTTQQVDELYFKLRKYSCIDDAVKREHVQHIQMKR
ncbi:nuclease-related domain-containing protein [Calidifontibacillus erzurumensis]|uniref:nuclease-related domain-containing protein n=1 Tax=Calidifontibacillus erzurumensis TaxID=2741433 RepID=UPI0035B54F7D